MKYYVYENWTVHKARIHLADCSYCNNGNGIHHDTGEKNGKWHGPFATLDEVTKAANDTREPVSKCKRCKPT